MDVKVENEVTLSREELADWLADLADALREDGSAELPLAGPVLTLALSDETHVEIEAHIDGDDIELELELSWSTRQDRRSESRDDAEDSENGKQLDAERTPVENGAAATGRGENRSAEKGGSGNGTRPKEGTSNGAAARETRAASSSAGSSSGSGSARATAKGRP